MTSNPRPAKAGNSMRHRWRPAALGVAAVLTMGSAIPTVTAMPDECVGVEAWVSVLGGPAMGVTEKFCIHPTGCNTLTFVRQEQGPPDVVRFAVGVWVPSPVNPDPFCLV